MNNLAKWMGRDCISLFQRFFFFPKPPSAFMVFPPSHSSWLIHLLMLKWKVVVLVNCSNFFIKERTRVPSSNFSGAKHPRKAIAQGTERRSRLGCGWTPAKTSKSKFKFTLALTVSSLTEERCSHLPKPPSHCGDPRQPFAPGRLGAFVEGENERWAVRPGDFPRSQS